MSLEIGGTNLRYGVIDEKFQVLDFKKESSRMISEAADKGEYIKELVKPYFEKYGKEKFRCLTLSLASLMNRERTINFNSPNIKGFDNISLVDMLKKQTGLPVFMERDVNTALLYEIWKGHIDKKGIIIGIFIGTGLGNAMCIDGEVYIGSSGSACELGHIPVMGFSDSCGCGKNSCIELKASGRTLAVLASEKYRCPVGEIFVRYGREEDVLGVVHACAIATATEITILDPEYVVLGGGVVEMEGFPMEYFRQTVLENVRVPYPRNSIKFLNALGDPKAGIIGAAINADNRLSGSLGGYKIPNQGGILV